MDLINNPNASSTAVNDETKETHLDKSSKREEKLCRTVLQKDSTTAMVADENSLESTELEICNDWMDFIHGNIRCTSSPAAIRTSGYNFEADCSEKISISIQSAETALTEEEHCQEGAEISLRNQLLISSDNDSEEDEEENPTGEAGGQFWMKLATAGARDEQLSSEMENKTEVDKQSDQILHGDAVSFDVEDGLFNEEDFLQEAQVSPKRPRLNVDKNEMSPKERGTKELDVFSLGNYCRASLSGHVCHKGRCSWVHYLSPRDAVFQLYKIVAHRSQEQIFTFARFCCNTEIQQQLAEEARQLLPAGVLINQFHVDGNCEEIFDDHREISRAVFRAVMTITEELNFDADRVLEFIEYSQKLFAAVNPQHANDVLVPLFVKAQPILETNLENKRKLIHWAWNSLYLPHLNQGTVLPQLFYTNLCSLLATSSETYPQLAELLLYCSFVPTLTPSISGLHTLLMAPDLHLNTLLHTAKCLANLKHADWRQFDIPQVLPGLSYLAHKLQREDPIDVAKFYATLPQIEGLNLPDNLPIHTPDIIDWIDRVLLNGDWNELSKQFFKIHHTALDELAEYVENLLEEVERIAEAGRLRYSIPDLFGMFVGVASTINSPMHQLFIKQFGLALVVILTKAQAWCEANIIIGTMPTIKTDDLTSIGLPASNMFVALDKGLLPLFILEVLVRSRQTSVELVTWLEKCDYLENVQEGLVTEMRNKIYHLVLERIVETTTSIEAKQMNAIVRLCDILVPSVSEENDPLVRRSHTLLFNKIYRGIVYNLVHNRLLTEAAMVYKSAVLWGAYSRQTTTSRPLTLLLNTSLTMEEMYVIIVTYIDKLIVTTEGSLTIFVHIQEMCYDTKQEWEINHISCIPPGKEDGITRLKKVIGELEPPLSLSNGSVPCIHDRLVRRFIAVHRQ